MTNEICRVLANKEHIHFKVLWEDGQWVCYFYHRPPLSNRPDKWMKFPVNGRFDKEHKPTMGQALEVMYSRVRSIWDVPGMYWWEWKRGLSSSHLPRNHEMYRQCFDHDQHGRKFFGNDWHHALVNRVDQFTER